MKYIHFDSAGTLAGLAAMLECFGHDIEDRQIAFGMEAPWLFLKNDRQFVAGQGLYKPRWLNLYLLPRGFRLCESLIPKENVPLFLQQHCPSMLKIRIDRNICHPVVCTGYAKSRYQIINVKTADSHEPDHLSLSQPMLLRRIEDNVRILTLEQCSPEAVDFTPLLVQSLQTLTEYEHALLETCTRAISREDFNALRSPLLRALFVDMLPMIKLLNQPILLEELRLLNHDYRHTFTRNSPEIVNLWEHLPRTSIRKCIKWLMENVEDRLYEHGMTDEQAAALRKHIEYRR